MWKAETANSNEWHSLSAKTTLKCIKETQLCRVKEIAANKKKIRGEDALKRAFFHHDNNHRQKASRYQVLSCYKLFVTARSNLY